MQKLRVQMKVWAISQYGNFVYNALAARFWSSSLFYVNVTEYKTRIKKLI